MVNFKSVAYVYNQCRSKYNDVALFTFSADANVLPYRDDNQRYIDFLTEGIKKAGALAM